MALINYDHLNDLLQSLLDVGCDCLVDSVTGAPGACFISHNQPSDDCCDFLAVWVNRIRPRIGAENAAYVTGEKVLTRCGDVGAVADVTMRLLRPCFPTLKDNPMNPFPGADEMQQAAENLLIDVQMLRCCVAAAACQGVLFPIGVDCQDFFIGDITPIGPRGGCAGWDLTFAFELDSCAYGTLSS